MRQIVLAALLLFSSAWAAAAVPADLRPGDFVTARCASDGARLTALVLTIVRPDR